MSRTGILRAAIARIGMFYNLIENKFVTSATSADVIKRIRKLAIQNPKKSDPASPTNNFSFLEKLCFKKKIIEAIKITETTELVKNASL